MLCNGFSGHGLQHSPAAGRGTVHCPVVRTVVLFQQHVTKLSYICGVIGVAELVVHGHFTSIDLSIFSFNRILDNKPIREVGIV